MRVVLTDLSLDVGQENEGTVDRTGRTRVNPSQAFQVATSATRPANITAYTALDVVGAAAAAWSWPLVGPSGATILLDSVSLRIDRTTVIASEGAYTLHLYNVTPPSALADNAVFDLVSGDRASYLGNINITIPIDLGATVYSEVNNIGKQLKLAGTGLFGYLVTAGGYTPESATVHTLTLGTKVA